ncbi:MAG: heat-shock protein Hsp20 [Leptothrix sp. (in: Bacteria)]|nr:heat-shock protein Hsp20 [Leptothrix sp. (in: b-proteobacteria)]
MSTLTAQVKHGAEQAWSTLAEGWQSLRARASGALTRFGREGERGDGSAARVRGELPLQWGLMAADIRSDDGKLVVRIEAPGMARDDMHIEVEPHRLCVWGDKRSDGEWRDGDCRLVQCAYGSFRRELALPVPVDADRASASYRDGVLRIELPRLDGERGRRIPVRMG